MIVYTLGKAGYSRTDILYEMHAGLVNQLMACHWMENGIELQSSEEDSEDSKDILATIARIKKRSKPKFNF